MFIHETFSHCVRLSTVTFFFQCEIKQWLSKAVGNEVTKWMEGETPEQMDGFYHSEIAIDVIQV